MNRRASPDHRAMHLRPAIRLQIGSLSIHGFAEGDQAALLAAFEEELAELIETRGLPAEAPIHLPRARLDCAPAPSAEDAGRNAARLLYARLRLTATLGELP